MTIFTDQWRADAKTLRDAADKLLSEENAESLAKDIRLQMTAVIGKIGAMVLEAKSDILDYLVKAGAVDAEMQKRQSIMEKNDAIRRAASKGAISGDWSEFDKLSKQLVPDAADGSDGS